ncbi:MAG: aromatic ring-hydroxylating oxygenase subunit alpha [Paracoccaceae bacterium]
MDTAFPSPRLTESLPTLPAAAYSDPAWYDRERRAIWWRDWVCAGRLNDMPRGRMRGLDIAGAPVLVVRAEDGTVSAFHNACRHRGAELCPKGDRPAGRLITCPYHAWSYAAADGRLVATGHARPAADFRRDNHGLKPVATRVWAGFLFLSLADTPPPLAPDMGLAALDNWPMDSLVTGHCHVRELACNWKVFWENYNECLHCPGIHPELCDMVPVYRRGIMSLREADDWRPGDTALPPLKDGARTWTMTGKPCGPEFPGLTPSERVAGYTFVTTVPSLYVVGHVDYVRAVRLEPTGPTTTRLTAEWLFPPETLAQPAFSAAQVAEFASLVLEQDAEAAEMNQRGLASPAHQQGTLMPEEFDIRRFHDWVSGRLAEERP